MYITLTTVTVTTNELDYYNFCSNTVTTATNISRDIFVCFNYFWEHLKMNILFCIWSHQSLPLYNDLYWFSTICSNYYNGLSKWLMWGCVSLLCQILITLFQNVLKKRKYYDIICIFNHFVYCIYLAMTPLLY